MTVTTRIQDTARKRQITDHLDRIESYYTEQVKHFHEWAEQSPDTVGLSTEHEPADFVVGGIGYCYALTCGPTAKAILDDWLKRIDYYDRRRLELSDKLQGLLPAPRGWDKVSA